MSVEYKINKYMTKLENATDPDKMDLYFQKLKQYKTSQSGGGPVEDKLIQIRSTIKELPDKLSAISELSTMNNTFTDAFGESIHRLSTSYKNITSILGDIDVALKNLPDISNISNTEALSGQLNKLKDISEAF